jgi:uncharacterized protein (DUF952 family)
MYIFHITTEKEWQDAQASGVYKPANFAADGFIHCSFKDQVIVVANKYYRSETQMTLLKIDPDLVKARIIEENLEGGEEEFPHIYGPLPINAVIKYAALEKNQQGYYFFPAQLE